MQGFCAVFNWSNRPDREKNKCNYRFPSIVKNNGKRRLETFKSEKKKMSQIFRKTLTERKLERSRMKIMLENFPLTCASVLKIHTQRPE